MRGCGPYPAGALLAATTRRMKHSARDSAADHATSRGPPSAARSAHLSECFSLSDTECPGPSLGSKHCFTDNLGIGKRAILSEYVVCANSLSYKAPPA